MNIQDDFVLPWVEHGSSKSRRAFRPDQDDMSMEEN
jgi:hypothetical protein